MEELWKNIKNCIIETFDFLIGIDLGIILGVLLMLL